MKPIYLNTIAFLMSVAFTQPAAGQCWSVLECESFRVYHRQMPELARLVARSAEESRAACCRRWLGCEDAPWQPRCEVYLHPTATEYSRATGVPAEVPAHTTIQREGPRILVRRIDLHCDVENMVSAILPHEVTHVVIAGQFGERRPPLWASEAMAILSEPPHVQERHRQALRRHRSEGRLYPVGKLVHSSEYPDRDNLDLFYAQSVSVVAFLADARGHRAFHQFLDEGLRRGFEPALQKHYGWDMEQLEANWQRSTFGEIFTSTRAPLPAAGWRRMR